MDIRNLLPGEYLTNMRDSLGDSFGDFLSTYEKPPVRGLRFNLKKVRPGTLSFLVEKWRLTPVSWCESGYSYPAGLRPGLSPYYACGLFYMQEPSAMMPAELGDISKDDLVLDLCAAPGGKATRLSERAGIVVANDVNEKRARVLSSQIERLGIENTVVISAGPSRISQIFPGVFDAVYVDAPCSGEGLMRREPESIREWSPASVTGAAARQKEILESASRCLRNGGYLIYSTCTFEPCENEEQIASFLSAFPDFRLLSERKIWPHTEDGEGQYAVLLQKGGEASSVHRPKTESPEDFLRAYRLKGAPKLHILRTGLMKGEIVGGSYVPSHAEAMACDYENTGAKINFFSEEPFMRYLQGESLRIDELEKGDYELSVDSGWLAVFFDGYSAGRAKLTDGLLKNHYPKGLRLCRKLS